MNEPAIARLPDALKYLSADERRSSSKPRAQPGIARLGAGAQLQKETTPRSVLAAGRNKRRGPGRENRKAVVSLPAGRDVFEQRFALNRPMWGIDPSIFPGESLREIVCAGAGILKRRGPEEAEGAALGNGEAGQRVKFKEIFRRHDPVGGTVGDDFSPRQQQDP